MIIERALLAVSLVLLLQQFELIALIRSCFPNTDGYARGPDYSQV